MNEKILIAGGSGLVGKHLATILIKEGYEVCFLSRTKKVLDNIKYYFWQPDLKKIDVEAFQNCNYVINLSGTNIAENKWTSKQKQKILQSRISSTKLLFSVIKENNFPIKAFLSASAIGYYGTATTEKIYTETDETGSDFLAKTCDTVEQEVSFFETLQIRTVIIRTGIVLAKKGSALSKMKLPIKLGIGAPLGTGKQYFSWIHIEDLCLIYVKAIQDKNINGIFNAVAPNFINNEEATKLIAKQLHKPLWLPNIPTFVLQLWFGEMAQIFLNGSRISAKKILDAGFVFRFNALNQALENLLHV